MTSSKTIHVLMLVCLVLVAGLPRLSESFPPSFHAPLQALAAVFTLASGVLYVLSHALAPGARTPVESPAETRAFEALHAPSLAFVLCDQSTLTDGAHGGALTPAVLDRICQAVQHQLNFDVAPEWGGSYRVRRGLPNASDRKPGEAVGYIVDTLPQAPGAAAYHDRTEDGQPILYFARDAFDSLTQGATSLSVGISHECLETAGDPGANRWADRTDGLEQALELCDKVEDTTYSVLGVTVSNWCLQSAFAPGAPAPWDHCRQLSSQDGRTQQGYDIVRTPGNDTSDETGNGKRLPAQRVSIRGTLSAKRRAHKAHWSSRTYRRGVRLPR
jgi:hypothetical protein